MTIRAHERVIEALRGDLASDVGACEEIRGCPLILMADDAMGLGDLDVYAES